MYARVLLKMSLCVTLLFLTISSNIRRGLLRHFLTDACFFLGGDPDDQDEQESRISETITRLVL